MSRTGHYDSPYDNALRRLQDDLYEARSTVLDLLPESTQHLLNGYYSCKSRQETYRWEQDVAKNLAASATVLPHDKGSFFSDRAYCPLCGIGSTEPYTEGFSVPEGLMRHLLGSGNVTPCRVMKVVLGLARDYWERQFRVSEQEEEKQKGIRIDERKKSEPLFLVAAGEYPKLIDENLFYGASARSSEELTWAERRLSDLGFCSSSEGSPRSYTLERGEFVVFADPRIKGQIEFRVYKKPLPKLGRRPRMGSVRHIRFPDSWKHDLRNKFDTRFAQATAD